MNSLDERKQKLLKYIIDEYIITGNPVGSKKIISKYMTNVSAATIRNDMAYLEIIGLLEKTHFSSGRVPSTLGYKYYEKNFSEKKIDNNLKIRLKNIFSERNLSIDSIIDESTKLISEVMNLPTIIINRTNNLLLKRIDLVPINNKSALILVIMSNGELIKNIFEIKNKTSLKDISICIRIFNDRLIDCPIKEIVNRMELLKSIIKEKVVEYEFIVQEFIEKIFNTKIKTNTQTIHGTNFLPSLPEFQNNKKLEHILSILEDTSVWDVIAFKQQESGNKTSITFGEEIGENDLLFASTDIVINKDNKTQISMVGPTRIDYSKIKGLLEFIKDEIEKYWK